MNGLKMMKDLVSNMKPGEGILAEKIDALYQEAIDTAEVIEVEADLI